MKTKQTENPTKVCPNCEQWQNWTDKGYYDCSHDCAGRGFADKQPTPGWTAPKQGEHSPLPWAIEESDNGWDLIENKKTNDWIATIHSGYDGDEANAAYIVEACNNYERVKAAYDFTKSWLAKFDYVSLGAVERELIKRCDLLLQAEAQRDELLAALKKVLPLVESLVLDGEPYFDEQEQARAAIAKVEGSK